MKIVIDIPEHMYLKAKADILWRGDILVKAIKNGIPLQKGQGMTYGYCVYHKLECDYDEQCVNCPYNTKEDVEWFKQDEEKE